jgi:twitching motility protein PilI
MARKTSLREFQEYLAARLTGAAQGQHSASLLGVRAGDQDWLIELTDGGEILQAPKLTPVPLTKGWFAGLANIRGSLHAVSDFSVFCGGAPTPQNNNTRLLLIGSRYGSNAALLVTRMLGLRNPDDFEVLPAEPGAPVWGSGRYRDAQGKVWNKLSVRDLLADNNFMNIGV